VYCGRQYGRLKARCGLCLPSECQQARHKYCIKPELPYKRSDTPCANWTYKRCDTPCANWTYTFVSAVVWIRLMKSHRLLLARSVWRDPRYVLWWHADLMTLDQLSWPQVQLHLQWRQQPWISNHRPFGVRVQLKCDGTRWRTGGEVKGKLADGVGSQYSSHYLGTWCIQHYYRLCPHLGCQ
jgi:hypothetical protein